MKQRTLALLQQADTYHLQAANLFNSGNPVAYAQVVILAWLASMHRIDAYLYEHNWGLPVDSAQRTTFVKRIHAFSPLATAFFDVENSATLVHYYPSIPTSRAAAGNAMDDADLVTQVIVGDSNNRGII